MLGFGMRSVAAFLLSASYLAWAQQPFVPSIIATPGTPSTTFYGIYGGALVRSNDSSRTWTPLYITEAGLPQPPVKGFAIDPSNPSNLFLATTLSSGLMWKSTDGGNTWISAAAGLPTNSGGVNTLTLISDSTGTYLYASIGSHLYRSQNGAATWLLISNLPSAAGTLIIAPSRRAEMYFIDAATLTVDTTVSEGGAWGPAIQVPFSGVSPVPTIAGAGVPYFDSNDLYITVNIPSSGSTPYASIDGSAFMDQTAIGLGPFTQLFSGPTGPTYAVSTPSEGFFRSLDSGMTWQQLGEVGLDQYEPTAVDPNVRTTLYGVETVQPSTTPAAVITSTDAGSTWATIAASIKPTIGKPVPMFSVTLEQGAPYSVSFKVQTVENPAWQTPVTLSTSGEPWLQLANTSGNTPLANSITISTTGLLPGVYNSTITISAPGTFNTTVSVPVQLTVKPIGSIGPGYTVSTAAGSGSASGSATSGVPTSVGIGAARAVAVDPSGNIWFSAGNRIWELNPSASSNPQLQAVAGNGTNATSGTGSDPLTLSVANPDAIAFDSNGNTYFTEYAPERVRELSMGTLLTAVDMTSFNQPAGSHGVVLDPQKFMFLAAPTGILHYQNSKLQLAIPTTFSNPYAIIEDASENLYVSDMGSNQVFEITQAGAVSVVAGNGLAGFSGDGGPASQAQLNAPGGIAFDSAGTLYIADSGNNRIRTVTTDGTIHTIAGSGVAGFAGDGSTSDFAAFVNPLGVAVDASGNVYVADSGNNRVRMLSRQTTPTPALTGIGGPDGATSLAPGAIFQLYGQGLNAPNVNSETSTATWPRSLNGVSVTINGVAAPLYYAGYTQINGQVPFETANGTATAIVTVNGSLPAQLTFPVVAAEPDVLVQGGGQAVAVNQDGTVNTPSNPAHGGDVEVVYLSGIGIPNPPVPTGQPSPSVPPLAQVNFPYQITLNGQQTQVAYLGYAPGYPALVQTDFTIPTGVHGQVSLVITVNGKSSIPTNITVQ